MQSVSIIGKRVFLCLTLLSATAISAFSQDNSPWSRYGLGDIVPSGNIANRGMGQVGAAYSDFQTINFVNPASYSKFGLQRAIFDIGLDINSRKLSDNKATSYTSNNAYIPYMATGFQIKPIKAKYDWGLVMGLRPLTKVSYSIASGKKMSSGDSVISIYEGNGGTYQAFVGTAIGIKNFSIGVNSGYRFGSVDYSTKVHILNDTVSNRYIAGRKVTNNRFGSPFLEAGVQYRFFLKKDTIHHRSSSLQLGAYASLQSKLKSTKGNILETYYVVDEAGNESNLDTISYANKIKGDIIYPAVYGFGFMYESVKESLLQVSADYEMSKWSTYRYYGNADALQDGWTFKAGAKLLPDITGRAKSYWSTVFYSAGFHYGLEPYKVDGNMKSYGISLGAGLPIKRYSYTEYNRNNVINLALEFGQRGNRQGLLRENYFRFAIGFSMSDIWFIKRKYD